MLSQLPTALCLLLCSAASTAASSLATYSDANCQEPLTRLAGPNGYPDGQCTNVAGQANADIQSFMFTALDAGCTPTIYLKNETPDICSGEAEIGYISNCYNATWVYYSIDMCTTPTSSNVSSSTSASTSASSTVSASSSASASSATAATSHRISDGAIAGAVVGSVCGLGIIAAVCVYFFWFRPTQRERKRREIEESGIRGAAGGAGRKEEEDGKGYLINMHESHQRSHELQSMPNAVEAPGDNRANEIGNDGEVPVELPGDHEYDGKWDQRTRH